MKNHTIYKSLQEYFKNTPKEKVLEDWNEFQHLDNEGITVKEFLENQKHETLKQAALRYASKKLQRIFIPYKELNANVAEYVGFINGAKWQQEQNKNLYSEEEARSIWKAGQEYWKTSGDSITFEELTEQFKKK